MRIEMPGGRFNLQSPFRKVVKEEMKEAVSDGLEEGALDAANSKGMNAAVGRIREKFEGAFISRGMTDDLLKKVGGSKTFDAYMRQQATLGAHHDALRREIKKISILSASTHGGFTFQRRKLTAQDREVRTRLDGNMENQEAFARFLSDKGDRYDGDLDKANSDFQEWKKRQRHGMSDERINRRLGALAIHAAAAPVEASLQHVPVLGQSVNAAFNHASAAKMAGASWKGAGAIGVLAGLGQGLSSFVTEGWAGATQEEQMRRHFGQMSSPAMGQQLINGMRSMGFTNEEMSRLGSLGRAQGHFQGIGDLAKLDMAYGIGGEGVGALGAMSRSGMQGNNVGVIKEAIASGVVQGLKPGRFGEVLQGLTALLSNTSIGVEAAGGSGINTLAAALGQNGLAGAHAYSVLGAMDGGIRGHGGPFAQSMAFVAGHDALGGQGSYWDIKKEQDKGIQGSGNMKRVAALMARLAQVSGVDRSGATKSNQDLFEMSISEQFGVTPNAASKIASTFKGGKIDEAALQKEIAAAKPVQEQAYDAMIEQAGTMRSIDARVEAIRAHMGARLQEVGVTGAVAGVLDAMQSGGATSANPYAGKTAWADLYIPPDEVIAGVDRRRKLIAERAAPFEGMAPEDKGGLLAGITHLPNALMAKVNKNTPSDLDELGELQKVTDAAHFLVSQPKNREETARIESQLSARQLHLLDQLLQKLANIDRNTAEALRNGDTAPFMALSPLDFATQTRNQTTTINQSSVP